MATGRSREEGQKWMIIFAYTMGAIMTCSKGNAWIPYLVCSALCSRKAGQLVLLCRGHDQEYRRDLPGQ